MIAKNYRKFPEAMALQLVLIFGACVWHTSRPTTRAGRAIRAARGQLVKHTRQLVNWVKVATPQWWKDTKKAAKHLADQVREAMLPFVWDAPKIETMMKTYRDSCWQNSARTKVFELVESFLDTHHGNQARPLQWAMKSEHQNWVHVPSGSSFFTVDKQNGYRD